MLSLNISLSSGYLTRSTQWNAVSWDYFHLLCLPTLKLELELETNLRENWSFTILDKGHTEGQRLGY